VDRNLGEEKKNIGNYRTIIGPQDPLPCQTTPKADRNSDEEKKTAEIVEQLLGLRIRYSVKLQK
jgi:hypothetical protein